MHFQPPFFSGPVRHDISGSNPRQSAEKLQIAVILRKATLMKPHNCYSLLWSCELCVGHGGTFTVVGCLLSIFV